MRPKFWRILLPILILALFVVIMTSDWLLKRPFSSADDMQAQIETMRRDIMLEDWEQATSDWKSLRAAWRIVGTRVQFSVERDELDGLTFSLARLQGALLAEDKGAALTELGEAEEHWRDLGR